MAISTGIQRKEKIPDIFAEVYQLEGQLSEEDALASLGRFLSNNLGFLWHLMTGITLKPFQEIMLNGWFKKDRSVSVLGRACGKSWLIAVFSLMYCILNKNSTVVLVAANFRQVKEIFGYIKGFLKRSQSGLLRQCFDDIKQAPDLHMLECFNGSKIKGLPMSGEKIRGQRASVLVIDEGLLLSETIHSQVLKPFLNARLNAEEEAKIRDIETEMIRLGAIKEDERTNFPPNKMLVTSSASYKFQYLFYGIWQPYLDAILLGKKIHVKEGEEVEEDLIPTYFAMRMSALAIPKDDTFIDKGVLYDIEHGKNDPTSQRENEAIFTDSSNGYFDVQKLEDCTYRDGEPVCVKLFDKNEEYILAIDPAYGDDRTNDFFAMGLYMLHKADRRITQVHSFGKAGADIKEHHEYLVYLLTNFKIIWIIIDASGTEFIDGFNQSELAKKHGITLGYITANFEDENYIGEIAKAKNEWSLSNRQFVYPHNFNASTNRRTNEYLSGGISAKKVWFASRLSASEAEYNKIVEWSLPFAFKDVDGEPYNTATFIDAQDDWILQTKRQLGMIQVKSTINGTLQYDLPSNLKNNKSKNRARKDNYTTLMLGYYASKHVFDMLFTEISTEPIGFTPILIK
jgi:hypothetical protein